MSTTIPTPEVARALSGVAHRWRDEVAQQEADTVLAAANIAAAIRRNLANVQPLNDDQRRILSDLLAGLEA